MCVWLNGSKVAQFGVKYYADLTFQKFQLHPEIRKNKKVFILLSFFDEVLQIY